MNELMVLLPYASPDTLLDIIQNLKGALDRMGKLDDYHRQWCKRVEGRLRSQDLAKAA
jgi:hypothetical protein